MVNHSLAVSDGEASLLKRLNSRRPHDRLTVQTPAYGARLLLARLRRSIFPIVIVKLLMQWKMVPSFGMLGAKLGATWPPCPKSGHNTSICNQSHTPIQPPDLCWTGNEYLPKCDDALRLGVKPRWLIRFVNKFVTGR